ncbi:MAG: disulfide oxidoreductase, partial [Deltaproteobacteria bacterium]|nr:disulfide oxidoreductase [Deltaproteobacteria bacterium]
DIVREHPALREKIRELFGPECLSCKSSRHESVTYTSWHKGLDPKKVVNELNALLKK